MRTETYNALRQYSVDRIAEMNASLTAWDAYGSRRYRDNLD